jgi:GTP cyclohydrolase I
LNTLLDNNGKLLLTDEEIGDDHIATSVDTPMRADAFELSDEEKIAQIEYHFRQIMETLGLDLTDDSLKGTPKRVAKMYVKEIFSGLDPKNKPSIALFENKYQYNEMLVEKIFLSIQTANTILCLYLVRLMWLISLKER